MTPEEYLEALVDSCTCYEAKHEQPAEREDYGHYKDCPALATIKANEAKQ